MSEIKEMELRLERMFNSKKEMFQKSPREVQVSLLYTWTRNLNQNQFNELLNLMKR